jgi:hypothetical protein
MPQVTSSPAIPDEAPWDAFRPDSRVPAAQLSFEAAFRAATVKHSDNFYVLYPNSFSIKSSELAK